MELCRDAQNGSRRKPCLCILANMDDDDVVMHDADCSYCDGGFLETAFLEDSECDGGSCLTFDAESPAEVKGGIVKFRTEELTVRCPDVVVKFTPEKKVAVKRVVVEEDKEAQLDRYIATLQRNNARLLQRFHEVQEDKKRAERRDEELKRKRRTTVAISLRVRVSQLSGHRSVSLVEKPDKRSRRRNRDRER